MLHFNDFWQWLINSSPMTIPTLGTQDGNREIQIINLPANQNPDTGFFTIHVDGEGVGSITIPNGNLHHFSRELAQCTWDRFFGLLSTTARTNGFHHAGGHISNPLPQIFTHQMASSYILPPNPAGSANLHNWFDCPNTVPCVFLAASVRSFLLTNLPADHILYQFI